MFIFLCLSVYSVDISGVLNCMPSSVLIWNAWDRYGSYHHRAFNSIGKKWWSPKQRLLNEITLFWQQDEPLACPSNSSAYILSVTCRRILCLHTPLHTHTHTHGCLHNIHHLEPNSHVQDCVFCLQEVNYIQTSRPSSNLAFSTKPTPTDWMVSLSSEHP